MKTCCAPGCKTGYKNDPNRRPDGPVTSLFQFPKDSNLRAQWIAKFPRYFIQYTLLRIF